MYPGVLSRLAQSVREFPVAAFRSGTSFYYVEQEKEWMAAVQGVVKSATEGARGGGGLATALSLLLSNNARRVRHPKRHNEQWPDLAEYTPPM